MYMRQHISGSNNLKNTTLQELGLSKGKAIIRCDSKASKTLNCIDIKLNFGHVMSGFNPNYFSFASNVFATFLCQ